MFNFVMPLLFAAPAGASGGQGGAAEGLVTFVPFILIIVIFYFLIIRPQSKKQKETQKMLNALKKGDKVVTIGGIKGTITNVREKAGTVILKVDDNTKIEFTRNAIASVEVSKDDDEEGKGEPEKIEDKKDEKSE